MDTKSKIKDEPVEVAPGPERNPLLVTAEAEAERLAVELAWLREERDNHTKAVKERNVKDRAAAVKFATAIRELAPAVTQAERAAANLRKIYEGK